MILVAYLKASSLSLVPLVICVMSLIFLEFIFIQWDKFELCAMLLSNNLICILMTSLWIPCSPFLNHFVCTCFFVDVYPQWFVYLETYTYERGHLLFGILFLSSHLVFIYNSLVAPNLSRECLSYFYLHLCALTFYWRSLSSCLSRWAC